MLSEVMSTAENTISSNVYLFAKSYYTYASEFSDGRGWFEKLVPNVVFT